MVKFRGRTVITKFIAHLLPTLDLVGVCLADLITSARLITICELAHPQHTTAFFNFALPQQAKMAAPPAKNERRKESSRSPFTPEQLVVLNNHLPAFLQAKRSSGKKLVGFWEPLNEALFAASPLNPLTDEEIACGVEQGKRVALIKKVSDTIQLCAE